MSFGEGEKNATTTPEEKSTRDHDHTSDFGNVFANELAMDAITRSLETFPEGSILVREKPSAKDSTKPELLAVMIKREAGFNPVGGDWQFQLSNGSMSKIEMDQKTGECLDCHKSQKESDFVYPLIPTQPSSASPR